MKRDARGRIMADDPRFGLLCECGNLKGRQARTCRDCYREALHDEAYWARRRCADCGGPKTPFWPGPCCHRCASARRVGTRGVGRPQPVDHPWRARVA